MHVRPARVDDRAQLVELWERSVRATHRFLEDGDIVGLRPQVAEALANDATEWWVLESAGTLIGFLGYANDAIEGLFIDPDHRRLGAGKALIAHAQQLAGGALAVDVNEQNDAARQFYESQGFIVVGRSPTDPAGRPFPLLHMTRTAPTAG